MQNRDNLIGACRGKLSRVAGKLSRVRNILKIYIFRISSYLKTAPYLKTHAMGFWVGPLNAKIDLKSSERAGNVSAEKQFL